MRYIYIFPKYRRIKIFVDVKIFDYLFFWGDKQ